MKGGVRRSNTSLQSLDSEGADVIADRLRRSMRATASRGNDGRAAGKPGKTLSWEAAFAAAPVGPSEATFCIRGCIAGASLGKGWPPAAPGLQAVIRCFGRNRLSVADRDALGFGLRFGILRQSDRQHAVLEVRLDLVGLHFGVERDAALEATIVTLGELAVLVLRLRAL